MRTARYIAVVVAGGLLVLCGLVHAASPSATPSPSARSVVESAMQEVMTILRDKNLAPDARRGKVRDIAYGRMDFETLSRLSLGRNWRELSEPQRTEFIKEFRTHMSVTYGHSIDRYTDENIRIAGDRGESNGDWTVQTTVGKPGASSHEAISIDYRLRQKDNQWKVIDVTVDGVSMIANFRAQFQDVIANGGIDRLLKLLREKNAAAGE